MQFKQKEGPRAVPLIKIWTSTSSVVVLWLCELVIPGMEKIQLATQLLSLILCIPPRSSFSCCIANCL
jgi:hypothetical protein